MDQEQILPEVFGTMLYGTFFLRLVAGVLFHLKLNRLMPKALHQSGKHLISIQSPV